MIENDGKIILSGFKLEPTEKAAVDNLILGYKSKMERLDYKEIRLRMKKSMHGKAFLHEVQGKMMIDRLFTAETTDYNLFSALSETLDKLMHEAEHHKRTARQ